MYLMNMNEKSITVFSIAGAIFGFLFGEFDVTLKVFLVILIVDTLSGMFKGFYNGIYESKKFRQGVLKKSGYMIAIILAVQLDNLVGKTDALRTALLFCFIANESTSIIENLGAIGIKFPDAITNAIAALKDRGETSKDK